MGFEADEEILQDFIVEAGEILDQLSEQLVELERNPDDRELLNAIFRGFHTVKGGAGFLQLDALVSCCHIAENVFDILRNGKRSVDAELMDVVLRALDAVNEMFAEVRNGQTPLPADAQLLKDLERFAKPQTENSAPKAPAPAANKSPVPNASESAVLFGDEPDEASLDEAEQHSSGDITDDEFEHLLGALDGPEQKGSEAAEADLDLFNVGESAASSSSEITDDEFEQLLNELHGDGKPVSAVAGSATVVSSNSEDISDDEFERLLDDLHGKGKFDVNAVVGGGKDTGSTVVAESTHGAIKDGGELISDNEFEQLLDDLHGAGKAPTSAISTPKSTAPKSAAPRPTESKSVGSSATTTNKDSAPARKTKPVPAADPEPDLDAESEDESRPIAKASSRAAPAPKADNLANETTVRVDTKRLDDIMNMVGELVLVRNRLKRLGDMSHDEAMQKAVSNLDVVTGDLQSAVMQTRMQPIKKVFGRFPRVVRDLARNMRKEVNLVLIGEETDLDKNLVEALSDPLVHLVRNAVDHGIESPEVREKNGKPRIGRVVLSAQQEGDHIILAIEDDGAGMDPVVLRQKAVEKGMYDEDGAARLTDAECYNLIFAPGFSTKAVISDISGRGVGMDVVKTKITQLNGTVTVDSEKGKGSHVSIKVPLTLAIMPTLMVKLGDQAFAFPLVSVVEIFHLDLRKTNVVDGQECVVVRDHVYPLFYIKRWLVGSYTEDAESAHVVIVSVGTKRVGFIVDQLVGQEEVVIKPLGGMLHGTPGMAGATITGDGRIALILDIPSLLQRYAGKH